MGSRIVVTSCADGNLSRNTRLDRIFCQDNGKSVLQRIETGIHWIVTHVTILIPPRFCLFPFVCFLCNSGQERVQTYEKDTDTEKTMFDIHFHLFIKRNLFYSYCDCLLTWWYALLVFRVHIFLCTSGVRLVLFKSYLYLKFHHHAKL